MNRVLTAIVLGCALAIAAATRGAACTAEPPPFEHVLATARAIVDGRIEGFWVEGRKRYPIVRVHEVLRGIAPTVAVVDRPPGICGGAIEDAKIGMRVVVALDVRHGGQVIHPYWDARGQSWSVANTPAQVSSADQLAELLRQPGATVVPSSEAPASEPTSSPSYHPTPLIRSPDTVAPTVTPIPVPIRSPAPPQDPDVNATGLVVPAALALVAIAFVGIAAASDYLRRRQRR